MKQLEYFQYWLIGSTVVEGLTQDRGFEPHRPHCVVSMSKNINPSLVLVQLRKICLFITERLLMGRKESNQTKQYWLHNYHYIGFTDEIKNAPDKKQNEFEFEINPLYTGNS